MAQILVYTPIITPRINYIFNFIFNEILKTTYTFTTNTQEFTAATTAKFSYGSQPLTNELFFKASPLLLNNNITPLTINLTNFNAVSVPFAVQNSTLSFDVFAASFYFLTRYEEYLPFVGDEHDRFLPTNSLQHKLGLLKQPIIDEWALILKEILLKTFPDLIFWNKSFEFIPTIDVDRAYHFRSSGLLKNTARAIKSAFNLDTDKLKNLINTGLKKQKDPFDTYSFLQSIHQKYNLNPVFFFLYANGGHSTFDVSLNPQAELFKNLIIETNKQATVGLHPSYASNANTIKIKQELHHLQQLFPEKINNSRQHYLKLQFPKTYLQLLKIGITNDYTMGYANDVGFRAGTCTPFLWYNLAVEKETQLKIHPFAVMDITLQKYLKLNPVQAKIAIAQLLANVKLVNGTFYSLWHNESLSETGNWKGWKTVYEEMLKDSCS